jgi:hypothetical protein
MALTEESKELLRTAVLIQLYAARATGLRVEPIHVGVKLAGFQTLEKEELLKQMRYLEAHQMVERADKEISKAVEVFLITEKGVAHLDESRLI